MILQKLTVSDIARSIHFADNDLAVTSSQHKMVAVNIELTDRRREG